jgi:hypothetical protein
VAGKAISSGRTGTGGSALEKAETQLLQRSVPQTQADHTDNDPLVARIDQARIALGQGDSAGSVRIINQILSGEAPGLAD